MAERSRDSHRGYGSQWVGIRFGSSSKRQLQYLKLEHDDTGAKRMIMIVQSAEKLFKWISVRREVLLDWYLLPNFSMHFSQPIGHIGVACLLA